MFLIATFAFSPFFLISFASSFLLSSVNSGYTSLITVPSLVGVIPMSDAISACSISPKIEGSNGLMAITLASGTDMLPTC